jgi:hypothetical protein
MSFDIEGLTLKQIREIQALLPLETPSLPVPEGSLHPYKIGQKIIVRTVTMHFTGKVEAVYPGEIVLSEAAWIADTGRWAQALLSGELGEVEPYPDLCIVSRGAIVDVSPWLHNLPRTVK